MTDEPVCAVCGENREQLVVHEGEKGFHLDCYLTYKRRAKPRAI